MEGKGEGGRRNGGPSEGHGGELAEVASSAAAVAEIDEGK